VGKVSKKGKGWLERMKGELNMINDTLIQGIEKVITPERGRGVVQLLVGNHGLSIR